MPMSMIPLEHRHKFSLAPINIPPRSRSRPKREPPPDTTCDICADHWPTTRSTRLTPPTTVTLPDCDHTWCAPCLRRIFEISMEDESQMPPKCCNTPLPLKVVYPAFANDQAFCIEWNKKNKEYSFDAKDRIYCFNETCGEWVDPDYAEFRKHATEDGGRVEAVCSHCGYQTCARCQSKWHNGANCASEDNQRKFEWTVKLNGWQKCRRCGAVIERTVGCNAIFCTCGHEFCYRCGQDYDDRHECPREFMFKEDHVASEVRKGSGPVGAGVEGNTVIEGRSMETGVRNKRYGRELSAKSGQGWPRSLRTVSPGAYFQTAGPHPSNLPRGQK